MSAAPDERGPLGGYVRRAGVYFARSSGGLLTRTAITPCGCVLDGRGGFRTCDLSRVKRPQPPPTFGANPPWMFRGLARRRERSGRVALANRKGSAEQAGDGANRAGDQQRQHDATTEHEQGKRRSDEQGKLPCLAESCCERDRGADDRAGCGWG